MTTEIKNAVPTTDLEKLIARLKRITMVYDMADREWFSNSMESGEIQHVLKSALAAYNQPVHMTKTVPSVMLHVQTAWEVMVGSQNTRLPRIMKITLPVAAGTRVENDEILRFVANRLRVPERFVLFKRGYSATENVLDAEAEITYYRDAHIEIDAIVPFADGRTTEVFELRIPPRTKSQSASSKTLTVRRGDTVGQILSSDCHDNQTLRVAGSLLSRSDILSDFLLRMDPPISWDFTLADTM